MARRLLYSLACSAAILLPGTANATLLSYESFDYTTGQALNAQNGGLGWGSNAWNAAGQYTVVSGLSFSDYPVLDNAVELNDPATSNAQLLANRQVASTANPTTLWYSYLYRPDTTANNNYNGLQLNTSTTNVGAARLRSANRGWSTAIGGVGVDNGVTFGSQNFVDATTYLVISKFTGLSGSSITGKWWSLRTSEYDSIKAGGISEAELDATNYDNSTETVGLAYSFDTGKYVQIQWVASSAGGQSATYDELRHATQLADLFTPIPESSTFFLGVLGLLGLLGWARRRRR